MILNNDILEEGRYRGKIIEIRRGRQANTRNGKCPTIEVDVELIDMNFLDNIVSQRILVFNGSSKLEELFTSALKEKPEVLDTDDLIGKLVDVEVVHKEKNGKVYVNISNFFPATNNRTDNIKVESEAADLFEDEV